MFHRGRRTGDGSKEPNELGIRLRKNFKGVNRKIVHGGSQAKARDSADVWVKAGNFQLGIWEPARSANTRIWDAKFSSEDKETLPG